MTTLSEAESVVALFQVLIHRLDEKIREGRLPEPPPDWPIRETNGTFPGTG